MPARHPTGLRDRRLANASTLDRGWNSVVFFAWKVFLELTDSVR